MNRRIILASLLSAAILTSCAHSAEVTLRAMTYNTYSNRNSNIEEVARVIREADPDVVALQEVERFTALNPGDVPARMAELTGMRYYYFIHALDIRKGGDYGNAILSKYPVVDSASHKLYGVEEKDYVRSFGYVKIEKDGRQFWFAATHLDHKADDASRLKMIADMLPVLRGLDAPVMLAGDFNDTPESRTLQTLSADFDLFNKGKWLPTVPVPVDESAKRIDYLTGLPKGAFSVRSYSVDYDAGDRSDHYPVVGDFILNF